MHRMLVNLSWISNEQIRVDDYSSDVVSRQQNIFYGGSMTNFQATWVTNSQAMWNPNEGL